MIESKSIQEIARSIRETYYTSGLTRLQLEKRIKWQNKLLHINLVVDIVVGGILVALWLVR